MHVSYLGDRPAAVSGVVGETLPRRDRVDRLSGVEDPPPIGLRDRDISLWTDRRLDRLGEAGLGFSGLVRLVWNLGDICHSPSLVNLGLISRLERRVSAGSCNI